MQRAWENRPMSDSIIASAAARGTDGRCPVCGTYAGPTSRCPACGAELHMRTSLRVFRWAALGLGTVGLALLFAMARHREIPLVRADELSRTMNFAYVRLAGEVPEDARLYRRSGRVEGLRFTVRDETGEIAVRAPRDRAQWLADHDLLPAAGDRVEVTGSVNVNADGAATLWIQAPEQFRLIRQEPPLTPIGRIGPDDADRVFRIVGEVAAIHPPRPGSRAPWVLEVRDESGSASLILFSDVQEELAAGTALVPGARFEARVTVSLYRGALQLVLKRAGDLRWISPEEAAPAPPPLRPVEPTPGVEESRLRMPDADEASLVNIADITPAMTGRTLRVRGRIQEIRPPREGSRAPWQWELADNGATIPVVYWAAVAKDLVGDRTPAVGRRVEVAARLSLWRRTPQLRIERAEQIQWLPDPPVEGEEGAP